MIDQADVSQLYNWSVYLSDLKADLAARKEAFRIENAALVDGIETYEQRIAEVKDAIAQQAIAEYHETGKKKLAHGISIREMKVIDYDQVEALNWAIGARVAVKLDTGAFDKIAGTGALSFVTIGSKVSATFPMDREKLVQDG